MKLDRRPFRLRAKTSYRAAWIEVGGKRLYARSQWEANYARYLEWLKHLGHIADWEHEAETFWFEGIRRGCVSYLPDFKVTRRSGVEYHEVKGWMDPKSRTKLRRMKKYYPEVRLVVVGAKEYRALAKAVGLVVPGWVGAGGPRLAHPTKTCKLPARNGGSPHDPERQPEATARGPARPGRPGRPRRRGAGRVCRTPPDPAGS